MVAARQTSLREQLQDLFRRVGREYWPVRVNLPLSDDAHKKLVERLKNDPSEFAGKRVVNVNRLDGMKLAFEDGAWVLIRPSGTEPVVRIYAETVERGGFAKIGRGGAQVDYDASGRQVNKHDADEDTGERAEPRFL